MTISSWLNFGRPAAPGRVSAAGRNFLAQPYYSQCAVFASPLSVFFLGIIRYSNDRIDFIFTESSSAIARTMRANKFGTVSYYHESLGCLPSRLPPHTRDHCVWGCFVDGIRAPLSTFYSCCNVGDSNKRTAPTAKQTDRAVL